MFSSFRTLIFILWNVFFTPVQCAKKPHIIFFLVDDMGWNDVGFHGMRQIPTPNIDMLAANGVILNNYYTAPACSPSRSALMSGKYPTESGIQHLAIYDAAKVAMSIDYKILPQALNDLGYLSRMIGKWHLGFYEKKYTPLARGFKSHYGFWTGQSDMFFHTSSTIYNTSEMINVPDYEPRKTFEMIGLNLQNDYQRAHGRQGEYLTHIFTEHSVNVIRQHQSNKPLFLYVSHHGVHRSNFYLPVRAPDEYTKHFPHILDKTRRQFAGSLTAIDRSLGEILEALEQKNMLQDTLFVFSSDNGAPRRDTFTSNGGSNYPLRGAKISPFEGGVRANAFIWSPLLHNRGRTYNGLMYIADWMPTLYKAAGGNPIALGHLDGMNMWDAIDRNLPSPRTNILLQADPMSNMTGYRSGDYKIVSGTFSETDHSGDPALDDPPLNLPSGNSKAEQVLKRFYGQNVMLPPKWTQINCGDVPSDSDSKCDPQNEICLFNVVKDPCEYRNLAKRYPEVVKKLRKEMEAFEIVYPMDPPQDYSANPIFHSGYYSPWITNMCDFAEL